MLTINDDLFVSDIIASDDVTDVATRRKAMQSVLQNSQQKVSSIVTL